MPRISKTDIPSLEAEKSETFSEEWAGPIEVNQARINGYADHTEDHQWIHTNPEAAASGPFRSTIAHGFLILGLLNALRSPKTCIDIYDAKKEWHVGGGYRFPWPLKSGWFLWGRQRLDKVEKLGNRLLLTYAYQLRASRQQDSEGKIVAEGTVQLLYD